ncbi:MAG: hypothetical protein ACREGK_01475 [Geminicoccales bacterium]
MLPGEDAAAFAAPEAALMEELAPDGALQSLLAARIARAAWRLERAERIEAELFERHADRDGNLGLALIRDGNGARAFDTLLRYRGTTLAELWRALRLLKALQAEADPVRATRDREADLLPGSPGRPTSARPWRLSRRHCRSNRRRTAKRRSNPKPAEILGKPPL